MLDPVAAAVLNTYAPRAHASVYDLVRVCSPDLEPPVHFDPYVQAIQRAATGTVDLCFSGPPQHGKTVVSEHGLVHHCIARPGSANAYSTFSFERAATRIQPEVARIAFFAGLGPSGRQGLLKMNNGSQIRFAGTGSGQLTGDPVSGLHIVDDPIADRIQAESKVQRETIWGWFQGVAQTRRHPGSSVVVMMTRWHADDLVGRICKELGWPYLRIPAVCDSDDDPLGREIDAALWESKRPRTWLEQFERDAYTWAAMYQGTPRPRGDSLFTEPCWYDKAPDAYRVAYGADLAYSEQTRADYSVLIEARLFGGQVYVVNVTRRQCQAPEFTATMKSAITLRRGPILWYCSGTEKGTAQMVRRQVPTFKYKVVTQDKYARAIPCAEQYWNVGKWLLPAQGKAKWIDEYVEEMLQFTGMQDLHDDQVDASAALAWLAKISATTASGVNAAIRGR